jgi:hypothetical protein
MATAVRGNSRVSWFPQFPHAHVYAGPFFGRGRSIEVCQICAEVAKIRIRESAQKSIHYARVELATSFTVDFGYRPLDRPGDSTVPIVCEDVESVGQRHNAGRYRYILAFQAIVASAVPAFVAIERNLFSQLHHREMIDRKNFGANGRVLLDLMELLPRQSSRFSKMRSGIPILPISCSVAATPINCAPSAA